MFLIKWEGCIPYLHLPPYDTADINSAGMTTILVFWCVLFFVDFFSLLH